MRNWTKTAAIIFLAAASVYSYGAAAGGEPRAATPANEVKGDTAGVKVLEESSDPFSNSATNGGATTKPATEGQSVSANQVNINDAGTVEIHVNDANLIEVLRMLSLQSQKNIVASKDVRGTVTANLYDVTVREALDAILHANGYAYREKGNFIYVYTTKELADQEKADRKASTEVFRLFYTPATNVVTLIKPVMSSDGQAAATTTAIAGIESGAKDVGGNSHATEDAIVVTDYPENLDKIRKLIKEVDRRPQQILIEATILRATLTEDNQLGVDFNFLGGVNFGSFTNAGGQISSGDIGTVSSSASGTTAGPVPINADHANSIGTGTNFTNGINGFRVGLVTSSLSMFVSALESVTDTTVLANPKVLALNKQSGEVIVGREDGYLTSTVTQTSTVQTVDFLKTGTRLIFRPFIGDDGYVRMEIHPEDSSGGLSAANLPFKVTTEVTSNVMVKDGRTIVIGGLFREESQVGRSQIPFFGNLPLAGVLFRKETDHTQREEIIVLLTPHIITDDKAYSDASEQELKEGEKLRVGVRNGMMFFGRERLADSEYQKAVDELKKPEPDRKSALWHLDCALNLNPKFKEAITLKEQLTGHEVTTADNSTVRSFVRRQIMAEEAMPTTRPAIEHSVPITSNDHNSTVMHGATTVPAQTAEAQTATTQPVAQAASTEPVAETPATQNVAENATSQPTQATAAANENTDPGAQATAPAAKPQEQAATEMPASKPTVAATLEDVPASQPVAQATETPSNVAQSAASQPTVAQNATAQPTIAQTAASQPTVAQKDNNKEPVAAAAESSNAKTSAPKAQPTDTESLITRAVLNGPAATTQPSNQNVVPNSTITVLPTEEISTQSTGGADNSANDSSEEKSK